MTIEIDNWLKIPNAAAPGGESLDVAYNMQSMRRIRNLKSAIAFSERRVLRLEHFALEAEVSEELEKAYDSLAEERSHQNNMLFIIIQKNVTWDRPKSKCINPSVQNTCN